MSNTLFHDIDKPVTSEPLIWIRRLVIIRTLEPVVDVIREIPFSLGLNLIVTQQPPANSTTSLGHDVGKTLLTRLIRYLLGELRFADANTRSAIKRALPDSLVAGEFRINGEDWSVIRPLGAPSTFEAKAIKAESWRKLLEKSPGESSYDLFTTRLDDVVAKPIQAPKLTNKKRPIAWLDVLGWIARDQKCRYAHPLIWRHSEADSGNSALHVEDASTVLRSICGLMSHKEIGMFEAHDQLLDESDKLTKEKASLETKINAQREGLTNELQELLKNPSIGISELELKSLQAKFDSLDSLREAEVKKLNLKGLREQYREAVSAREVARASESTLQEKLHEVSEKLKLRKSRSLSLYETFAGFCDKHADDCPAKIKIATQKIPTPDTEELAAIEEELRDTSNKLAAVQDTIGPLSQNLTKRESAMESAERELSAVTAGIDGRIATYSTMIKRVDGFINDEKRVAKIIEEVESLDKQIKQSQEDQRQTRESLAVSREWFPDRFTGLCKELIGGSRKFALTIESKAIKLQIIGSNGTPGEATSTSALVICLDLAAMQSAIDGHCQHPRLMILDSPREADMELGIFNRLMNRLAQWHRASPTPTFQAILTTTTRPADELLPARVIKEELAREPVTRTLLGVEL